MLPAAHPAHTHNHTTEQHPSGGAWRKIAPLSIVFLAACWVFLAQLGAFPLFNPDEALYAEPAREMLDTGEYITTLLNYEVRYTKPPLVIWMMALCYQVFGVGEFAARFFGAACGAVLIACTYCFLDRYAGVRAALVGAATLLTAPLFIGTGREAIVDMPLSLFVAGSLFAMYRAYREKDGFWRWPAYALMGLAVMTKGPVGLVLPVLILGAYHFLRGDWRHALRFYMRLPGMLIVAAIALPWYVVEIAITKGEYFQAFIVRENFQRFTSVVDSHKGPVWYHLAAMMGGFFPWSVFLPQSLVRALAGPPGNRTGHSPAPSGADPRRGDDIYVQSSPDPRRGDDIYVQSSPDPRGGDDIYVQSSPDPRRGDDIYVQSSADPRRGDAMHRPSDTEPAGPLAVLTCWLRRYRGLEGENDLLLFAACWSLITLAFFSASVSKLLPYSVPAFPALAVLVALEISYAVKAGALARLLVPFALLAIIYGAAGIIGPQFLTRLRNAPEKLFEIFSGYVSWQSLVSMVALLLLLLKRPAAALSAFAVLTLASSTFFGYKAAVELSQEWEAPLPGMARYASASGEDVFVFDMRKPSVPFYTHRQVIQPGNEGLLQEQLAERERAFVLTRASRRPYFEAIDGCRVVSEEGRFLLVHWTRPPAQ